MVPYILLILLSVLMFGGGFCLQDQYGSMRGSGIKTSMEASCIGALAGLVALLALNGFSWEYTPFTLLMAVLMALNGIAFTFCSFKALARINLSLFSLFAMLGGMLLPFLQGILFYGENFTVAKLVCVVLIGAALACTVERGAKKRGRIFYIGIFVLNGMLGVLSKIFTASHLPKTTAAAFSAWGAAVTVVLAGLAWLFCALRERGQEHGRRETGGRLWLSYGISVWNGVLNKVANFLLVLALAHVDASVQYPMVTGGTMLVSTLLSCFSNKKPQRREVVGVCLAFLGMMALFAIPC